MSRNRFHDTIPVYPRYVGPQELTTEQADALIRASWAQRSGSGLRLVQPMAAEACTDVDADELPAADEYDWDRENTAASWFWGVYLAGVLVLVCLLFAKFLPA